MRWTQLIHPKEQLNVGEYYVLGVYDNNNEEVIPTCFGKLIEVMRDCVIIEEMDLQLLRVGENDYFIHVTKQVEL